MTARPPATRSGFTLIEVLVATVVTAVVVTLSTAVVATVADTLGRVGDHAGEHHRTMNSVRWLQHVLPSVDLDAERGERFSGSASGATLTAWSWSAEGWLERRGVRLTAGPEGLSVEIDGTPPVTLFPGRRVELSYLVNGPDGREWMAEWESGVASPLAVRFTVTDPEAETSERFTFLAGAGA